MWFSDRPLDLNEGAHGDVVLALDVPECEFTPFEWVEEGKTYREFLVPAEVANHYGPSRIVEDDRDWAWSSKTTGTGPEPQEIRKARDPD